MKVLLDRRSTVVLLLRRATTYLDEAEELDVDSLEESLAEVDEARIVLAALIEDAERDAQGAQGHAKEAHRKRT